MKPLLDQALPSDNQQNGMPSRGRVVSKLSRHNRRNRRGEKSRGDKRNSGRVPIPSFTPIPEYFNACGDEGDTRLSEQSTAALATCQTNECSDASKPIPGTTSIKFACASDDSNHGEADSLCLLQLGESQTRDRNHLINRMTEQLTCATCPSNPKDDRQTTESEYSMKETGSSPVVQSSKRRNPCSDSAAKNVDKNNEMIIQRRDCVSGESRLADIVEILDDEHDALKMIGGHLEKVPMALSSLESNKSSQAKRKRKPSPRVSRSSSDSSLKDEFVDIRRGYTRQRKCAPTKCKPESTVAATKTNEKGRVAGKISKTSVEKKLCFACVTCKCDGRSGTDPTNQKFSALSGSDARQEQSLVNRLQRIERDVAWKEGQRHDVARALKKHQLKMLKTWTDSNIIDQKPRFLADADVNDELRGSYLPQVGSKESIRAQRRVFGRQKTHQPTLTQIIRGPRDDNHIDEKPPTSENPNTVIIHYNCDSVEDSNCVASVTDARDDFLSFWTDTEPKSSQRHGTMSYYNRALANFNYAKSIGKWAKATATTLQLEEDEGFGALAGLFDSIVRCPRDSVDDDEDEYVDNGLSLMAGPLTPRGERVAEQIERSVKNDSEKMASIERMCPNWRENIEIAQAQNDPEDLRKALHNVQHAKKKLESMKCRILQAFLDRHQTLEMYEKSLEGSLDRLSGC